MPEVGRTALVEVGERRTFHPLEDRARFKRSIERHVDP